MRKKHQIVVVILVSLLIVGFFLSIYVSYEEDIPANAVVVVTLEDKQYHSIHFDHICVNGLSAETRTLSRALSEGFTPHAHCQDLGYFKGNRLFLFHHILSKFGVRVNSRWDENGNWLW